MNRTTNGQIDRLCSALKGVNLSGTIGELVIACIFPADLLTIENEDLIKRIEEES